MSAGLAATGPLRDAVAAFLQDEADLLDDRQWARWLELFEPHGLYWIPVDAAQDDPDAAPSHVYERRPALDARVHRLLDARVIPQTPVSRTARVLGVPRVRALADGTVEATARFHLAEARVLGEADDGVRLHAGRARYLLVPTGDSFRIRSKRVDLIDADGGLHGVSILL